jgi:hypothetical protein
MVKDTEELRRCAHPGCENELRPEEAGAAAQGCHELADLVAGEPHRAPTAFGRR